VRAQLVETRVLGVAGCSPDPEAICQDVLIEARLVILGRVAGPRVSPRAVVRYIAHIPLPRGALGWWLLTPSDPARRYRPARPLDEADGTGSRDLCVDRGSLMWFGTAPVGGTSRGDNICYPRRAGVDR
jgi:hypothetical protein